MSHTLPGGYKLDTLAVRLRNSYWWVNRHSVYLIYICIALSVTFFNLIAIFGSDVLIVDDLIWYSHVLKKIFPRFFMKYTLIYAYKEWVAWNIMAYSPHLARGLYVIFLMVPLSCCFYYLFHYKFGFSRYAAFTAAVLPNILPYQWNIPAGINLSYTLWGLLFAVFSLILALHYLEKTTSKNWTRLLGAVMLYFIALDFMEHSLFIFPALVFLFLGYTKFNKKHIWLISSFFILALAKFTWMIAVPRKPITDIPIAEMLRRIGLYLKWSLPSPDIEPIYLTIIYFIVILIGFILYSRDTDSRLTLIKKNFFHMNKKKYVLYIYAFFICWSVSSAFVFICMNAQCQPRHGHIPSIGLNALLIFSIYIILNKGFSKKYKLHFFVFIGIIIFSGISRYTNLKKVFDFKNNNQSIIIRNLNELKLPLDSQVVIYGISGGPQGWGYSSGYLKHALKRRDITGLIGPFNPCGYHNFLNHFNPKGRSFGVRYSMTGLSIDKPTFFFVHKNQKKFKQFEYALQWEGEKKNEPWTILKANKRTGKITPILSGTGWDEYLSTIKELEKKGVSQSEIFWGGPPFEKELERMGFDPIFSQGHFSKRLKKIPSARAKQVLLISITTPPFAKNINFGNKFQLVSSFSNEVCNRDGTVSKNIHFLCKTMIKQKIDKHLLAITLLKNQNQVYINGLKFCQPGVELDAGDYILGSVKIPADKFKEAENLGIQLVVVPEPPNWTSLKIHGNHKTDRNGFRLLIPIKNINK